MLEIVPYSSEDWNDIEAVHDPARMQELTYAGLSDAFLPLAIAAEREGLFDYHLFVAKTAGEVVGFVAFTHDELAWLYVKPEYQRKGIGRALAMYALSQMDPRENTVEVLSGNEPARQLYRSLGFVHEKIVCGRMPGNESFKVTVWQMTKQ